MENVWFKNRNKDIQEERLNSEISEFMNEWSRSKGKLKSDSIKRFEFSS